MRFWYLRRRPSAVRNEVDEELRIHLEMRIEDLRANGLSPDEARREAERQFGDIEGTRRYCRRQDLEKENRVQRLLFVQDLAQDARIGLRNLLRVPALALTVVVTVGLGIGATTAIFAAVNAALLQPLPYKDPDRLVRIYTDAPPNLYPFSVADYLALEAQQTHFEQIAGYRGRAMAFSNGAIAERLTGREVTWTYFRLLGITPAIGRDFTEQEGRPGHPRAVVISSWPVGTATGQPAGCRGAADSARWLRLHRCRHPPTAARTVRAAAGLLHCRAMVDASPQGPLLHHHAWASPRRRHPIRSRQRTAGDQPPPLSALAVVVPGRSCDVGSDGSQGVRRRRRSHDGGRRAGSGGAGVADRDGERRQPAGRARHEPPPRAGRPDGARRIPEPSRAVPARGERAPGSRLGHRRVGARVGRRAPSANRRRQLLSAHAGNGSQRSGAVAACRRHDRQRRPVRPHPCPLQRRRFSRRVAAIDGACGHRQSRGAAAATRAGGQPVRHRDSAAHRRRPAPHQPERAPTRRSRVRHPEHAHRRDPAARGAVSRECKRRLLGRVEAPRGNVCPASPAWRSPTAGRQTM